MSLDSIWLNHSLAVSTFRLPRGSSRARSGLPTSAAKKPYIYIYIYGAYTSYSYETSFEQHPTPVMLGDNRIMVHMRAFLETEKIRRQTSLLSKQHDRCTTLLNRLISPWYSTLPLLALAGLQRSKHFSEQR